MTTGSDFFDALRRLRQQARTQPQLDDEILQEFVRDSETFTLADADPEFEQRGLAYYCVPANQVSNGDFESDLTGWTELLEAGCTGSSAQTTEDSKTLFGSLGSCKLILTGSAGATIIAIRREQAITAAPGQRWHFECWAKATALSNARVTMSFEFRKADETVLEDWNVVVTAATGTWTRGVIESKAAPALTAKVLLRLNIESLGAGATGTAYYDVVRAEYEQAGAAAISARGTRIVCGEWKAS